MQWTLKLMIIYNLCLRVHVLEEYFTSLRDNQGIQTTSLCKKSLHQKSITYVIPMSDQFSSAFQKSADLDNALINEMTDELQPPKYFVLLGCVPNP
ncbi:hypothetical protein KY284_033273 [Solanum tuberosum]|nr:hypothetical protein KY284_033273 [Solanum tuberosum]